MWVGRDGRVMWLSLARGLTVSCGCGNCELPELGRGSSEAQNISTPEPVIWSETDVESAEDAATTIPICKWV